MFQEGLGFNRALFNSIGIAMITTLLALAFASMAAYAITRLDFPGKTLILAGALAVSMFPAISIVGGLFNVWRVVGLYDTWPGLILPYLSFSLPLSIYTSRRSSERSHGISRKRRRWTARRACRRSGG